MAHDAIDPAAGFALLCVVAISLVPDGDKGIVQHILGQGAITHDTHGDPEQKTRFVAVQSLQGLLVAERNCGKFCGMVESVRRR